MNTCTRSLTLAAAILGFLGVALGAFGAHGLKATLEANSSVETWKTAVLYHLVHAVALLALAGWQHGSPQRLGRVGAMWLLGVVMFSGSLYWLALGGPRFLGPITPIGGIFLLVGWLMVAWNAWRSVEVK